ncbi:MAG: DUF1669 domain-containing protein [Myxococcales bacterium]|nr:DUF1669 domain-containing protein [Myxococcales bacterium]
MWWTLLSVAQADDLRLVLYDPPSDRPAPLDTCDVPLCSSLLQMIQGATKTIDFAFYGFRNQTALYEAMKAAQARGVVVRGVVDMDAKNANYYASTATWMEAFPQVKTDYETDLQTLANQRSFGNMHYRCPRPLGFLGPLQCNAFDMGNGRCYLAAHVSREPITFEGDIMHDKFVVVDGHLVWTGSTNASDSCSGGYNANLVLTMDSTAVAEFYTSEIDQMVAGKFHGEKATQGLPMHAVIDDDTSVDVYFSPQHRPMTKVVEPLLKRANSTIDIAVFFLTHKGVAQDLLDAHARGVKVRVILDSTGAGNEYSKHEVLRLAGIPVKIEDWGGKLHAKSAVIDGRIVVAGSMNWTSAGENDNDENTVIITSPEHAAQYEAWFQRVWDRIPDKWLEGRPDPESRDSGTSCTDGVDNDYDGLKDAEDPGCGKLPPPLPATPPYQIVSSGGERCSWNLIEEKEE